MDEEIKVFSVENTELQGSPLKKPGVGKYIALHTTLTARDFFLACFYPSGPFTCISSITSPDFFRSCVGPKQVTLLDAGSRVECPRKIDRHKKNMTCEMNNFEIE